jgi:hypothetical protein
MLGVAMVAWAWWQASGSASQDEQTTWTVVAVLGVAVVTFAMTAWVRAGRRAVRLRRDTVVAGLVAATSATGEAVPVTAIESVPEVQVGLATYPSATRYHRPGCLLTRGKSAQALAAGGWVRTSLQPCEMCQS